MRYKYNYFLILFFLNFNSSFSQSKTELDSLLTDLHLAMSNRAYYDNLKAIRIDNLKDLLASDDTTLDYKYYLTKKIIEEYEYHSFNDALHYIEKNREYAVLLEDRALIDEANLRLTRLLVSSGHYKESMDLLESINRQTLDQKLLSAYYEDYYQVYSRLSYYSPMEESRVDYAQLFTAYRDSLMQTVSEQSETFLAIKEKQYRDNNMPAEEYLKFNDQRLLNINQDSRLYALITFERALCYDAIGDKQLQKKYLILSAIADIKNSVKDNASLTYLATIFYEENNLDLAYKFINFSFEDAEYYNSQFRFANLSNILPLITKAYESNNILQKGQLKKMLISISMLAIFLLGTIFLIYNQIKKLSTARNNLKSANDQLQELNSELSARNEDLNNLYSKLSKSDQVKVNSLGVFLKLFSDYINKLELYRKMVRKHLIANRLKDLMDLTKSNQIANSEIKIFNDNFDEAFLNIYPDFVEKINILLKPGETIFPNLNNEKLNTELRIFALIRLGISSSAQISKILRYSVNTIYNYRVKVKNSAINRDSFDQDVRSIS